VLGVVAQNPDLRRLQTAYAAFNGAEWAIGIAMLVYAYDSLGGATAAGLVALANFAPAAIFAPIASVLGDRRPPVRVLTWGYLAQGAAMVAASVVLFADGPAALAIACSAIATSAITITRPTQAVIVPALARTPEELTAANVVSGWNESLSVLYAPALAGILLGVSEPGAVFAVMGAGVLLAAALAAGVRQVPPANVGPGKGPFTEISQGVRVVAREPAARILVGLLGAELAAIGMLDVVYVVLALDLPCSTCRRAPCCNASPRRPYWRACSVSWKASRRWQSPAGR
jgi:MFS family permease